MKIVHTFEYVYIQITEKYLRDAQNLVEILIDFLDHVEYLQIIVIPRVG